MKNLQLNYSGKVENGQLKIVHRHRFDADIKVFEGKEVALTVKKKRNARSNQQNKYYWFLIGLIVERLNELGELIKLDEGHEWMRQVMLKTNKDLIHESFKELFIENIIVEEETGEIIKNKKSTTKMTTTEFMSYLEPIYQWSAEKIDLILPTPDSNYNTP